MYFRSTDEQIRTSGAAENSFFLLELQDHLFFFFSFFWLQEVVDESDGCGKKFSIVIVSEQFKGKSTLANHRYGTSLLKINL